MAKINKDDIVKALKEMTMLEIKDLIEAIEKEFNVSAAAPVAVAAAANGPAQSAAPSEVTVTLKEVGQNKVAVIKIVREITGLGLMEAKGLVDNAPSKIKENVKIADAEAMKKQFADAGATVEW